MKTKRGNEFDILGQSVVDGRLFFVCKLPEAMYYKDELIRVIVLPSTDFDFDNGVEYADVVEPQSEIVDAPNT